MQLLIDLPEDLVFAKIKPIADGYNISVERVCEMFFTKHFMDKDRTKKNKPKTPYEIAALRQWAAKEIDSWNNSDFLGYYIYTYRQIFGTEDLEFVKHNRKRVAYLNKLKMFRKTANISSNLRDYIDWYLRTKRGGKHWTGVLAKFDEAFSLKFMFYKEFSTQPFIKEKTKNETWNKQNMYGKQEFWQKDNSPKLSNRDKVIAKFLEYRLAQLKINIHEYMKTYRDKDNAIVSSVIPKNVEIKDLEVAEKIEMLKKKAMGGV